jgi:hypothetical protein
VSDAHRHLCRYWGGGFDPFYRLLAACTLAEGA